MKHSVLIPFLSLFAIFLVSVSFGLSTAGPLAYHFSPQGVVDPLMMRNDATEMADAATFNNVRVTVPLSIRLPLAQVPDTVFHVLGAESAEKRIEVDLSKQRLYAFEGDRKVYDFPVSTGLWGKTPTGEFRTWIKLTSTKMEGGSKALRTYYYLPKVPYTMFFANDKIPRSRGFGIHGAYWHNNFGSPMSHGCINMKPEEAKQLFYWAPPDMQGKHTLHTTTENPGTRVIIYGTAPQT